MRILAVDDDAVFLQLLTTILVDAGYDAVTTTESAEDAIRFLSSEDVKFDCFLLDIKMPEMSGIELCRKIRSLPDYRESPVIMLTALTDDASIEQAFEAGASDFVTKPLRGLEIGSRIRLAAQLNESRERNLALLHSRVLTGHLWDGTENAQRPAIMALSEIEGVVDYLELENYLLRIGKDVVAMRLFALAITSSEDHLQMISEAECGELFCDLVKAISQTTNSSESLIACPGDGVFVFFSKGRHRISIPAIEDVVHQVFGKWFGEEVAECIDFNICFDHKKNLGLFSGQTAARHLRSLVLKAAEELEELGKRRQLRVLREDASERRFFRSFFGVNRVHPRRVSRLHT